MIAPTHYAFSMLVLSAAGLDRPASLICSVFSLLPDIDHPASCVGRLLPGISRTIRQRYGHRTVTHSLFSIAVPLVLGLPIYILAHPVCKSIMRPLVEAGITLTGIHAGLVLAWSSHIFLDLFNVSGVCLFAPVSNREYISFTNPRLRMRVGGLAEYALLFLLVIATGLVTRTQYTVADVVHAAGRHIYRHYDGAVKDWQHNSSRQCHAIVLWYNQATRKEVKETVLVLNMYPEYMVALRPQTAGSTDWHTDLEHRLIIRKEDILEIEVEPTDKPLPVTRVRGTSLKELRSLPAQSIITGDVTIAGYPVHITTGQTMYLEKTADSTVIHVKSALPEELATLLAIEDERELTLASLRSKQSSVRLSRLNARQQAITAELNGLNRRGFYENYQRINTLTREQKKIRTRQDTLTIRINSGADEELQLKIRSLEKEYHAHYDLYVVEVG